MSSSPEHPLEYIFHPRSIAVIGASSEPGSAGNMFLHPFVKAGFKGKLYPVGRKAGERLNLKIYTSLLEIPEQVDYVVVCIPAAATPQLMGECVEKGVKAMAFFTAGFTETGEKEGIQLGKELVEIARKGGIRIIGPNCLGMYVPSSGLAFTSDTPAESGSFGFFSQSGGHTANIVRQGTARGLLFSKAISYGNASDLTELDFLDYFVKDNETSTIGSYYEGLKDGRLFFKLIKESARIKPIIALKGGNTEAGKRAIFSHTASMAGKKIIWDSMLKQAGALNVASIGQIVDAALAFTFLPAGKKKRLGVIGWGGGASVQASDDLEKYGLYLPPLSADIHKKLVVFNMAGSIIGNPFDTPLIFRDLQAIKEIIKIFDSWEETDLIVTHVGLGAPSEYSLELRGNFEPLVETYRLAAREIKKPAIMVLHSIPFASSWTAIFKEHEKCARERIPVYHSLEDAGRALSLFNQYWEFMENQK